MGGFFFWFWFCNIDLKVGNHITEEDTTSCFISIEAMLSCGRP